MHSLLLTWQVLHQAHSSDIECFLFFFSKVVELELTLEISSPTSSNLRVLFSPQPLIHFMGSNDEMLQEYAAGCGRNIRLLAKANRDAELYL